MNGIFLNVIRSFYAESEERVRECRKYSELLGVEVGLHQCCVMPPWLFSLFMDDVMGEIRETAGETGVRLIDD